MALVVFLRGVNVGGHRTFRPSQLATKLKKYDIVNVGAAGTFVVRKPGSLTKFRADLLRNLPFKTEILLCEGRDLLRLETKNPFGTKRQRPEIVRFVSILSRPQRLGAPVPISFPPQGKWYVQIVGSKKQFAFGVYRRHMKTIRYLGHVDKLFGEPITTRNWNTIVTILEILKA